MSEALDNDVAVCTGDAIKSLTMELRGIKTNNSKHKQMPRRDATFVRLSQLLIGRTSHIDDVWS